MEKNIKRTLKKVERLYFKINEIKFKIRHKYNT